MFLFKKRKNSNDLFNIKKDYLLTEVSKENYIHGVNRSSYKNSSRLKDKINEIIELSNSKVIKHPIPIKQDKDKTNSSNNNEKEKPKKKTLSEQRKDIFNLLY